MRDFFEGLNVLDFEQKYRTWFLGLSEHMTFPSHGSFWQAITPCKCIYLSQNSDNNCILMWSKKQKNPDLLLTHMQHNTIGVIIQLISILYIIRALDFCSCTDTLLVLHLATLFSVHTHNLKPLFLRQH